MKTAIESQIVNRLTTQQGGHNKIVKQTVVRAHRMGRLSLTEMIKLWEKFAKH